MALQSSGAISFSDLQSEFSDTGSVSMSELYKGGAIGVPSTLPGDFTALTYNASNFYWQILKADPSTMGVRWDGVTVYYADTGSVGTVQVTVGDYTYATDPSRTTQSSNSSFWFYRVQRRDNAAAVNAGIPESGVITLSDFYSGRGS